MADFIRAAAVAALCGALLVAAPIPSRAQTQSSAQIDAATWGLYARLAGSERQSPESFRVRWHWSEPGRALVEEYFKPGNDKPVQTGTITPGASAGTLVLKASTFVGDKVWNGTVQPDGSVVFVGTGLLKFHYKAVLASDGAYELRPVKMRNGAVASVAEPGQFNRYLAVDQAGSPAAASSVATAAQTAPMAATPTASPVAAPSASASFGFLDNYVGRPMVGNSASGITFTLSIRREGDTLVIDRGLMDGRGYGRIVLRATAVPGAFELVEMWDGDVGGNRSAYLAGSPGAPVSSPLDGYYADPRKPGDLVLSYDVSGGYVVLNLHPTETGNLGYNRNGGNRRFGIRGKIGDIDYVDVGWFSPTTDKTIAAAEAFTQSESRRQEEMRREEARDRAEQQSNAQAALYNTLQQAVAVATENEARSRAALDATLEQAARQAAYEQQTRNDRVYSGQDVQSTRTTTEHQPDGQKTVASEPAASARASATADPQAAAPDKSLRFVLSIGLQPRAGDSVNPTCYSNVITRAGPPGWGQRGFLPPGSAQAAQAEVQGMKSRFIAACRAASGREVTSEGDFHWTWNELRDGEAQIANTHAQYREDVTVGL